MIGGGLTTLAASGHVARGRGGGGGGEGGDEGESTTGGEEGGRVSTRGGSDWSVVGSSDPLPCCCKPLFCLRPLTILENPSSGRAGGGGGGGGTGMSVVGRGGKLLDARSSLGAGGGR